MTTANARESNGREKQRPDNKTHENTPRQRPRPHPTETQRTRHQPRHTHQPLHRTMARHQRTPRQQLVARKPRHPPHHHRHQRTQPNQPRNTPPLRRPRTHQNHPRPPRKNLHHRQPSNHHQRKPHRNRLHQTTRNRHTPQRNRSHRHHHHRRNLVEQHRHQCPNNNHHRLGKTSHVTIRARRQQRPTPPHTLGTATNTAGHALPPTRTRRPHLRHLPNIPQTLPGPRDDLRRHPTLLEQRPPLPRNRRLPQLPLPRRRRNTSTRVLRPNPTTTTQYQRTTTRNQHRGSELRQMARKKPQPSMARNTRGHHPSTPQQRTPRRPHRPRSQDRRGLPQLHERTPTQQIQIPQNRKQHHREHTRRLETPPPRQRTRTRTHAHLQQRSPVLRAIKQPRTPRVVLPKQVPDQKQQQRRRTTILRLQRLTPRPTAQLRGTAPGQALMRKNSCA